MLYTGANEAPPQPEQKASGLCFFVSILVSALAEGGLSAWGF